MPVRPHSHVHARRALALCLAGAALAAGAAPAVADPDDHGGLVQGGPSVGVEPVELGAVMPVPRSAATLPAGLDLQPSYQPGVSCDPVDRPGSTKLGRLLVDTYGTGTFGVSRFCNGTLSEHHEGRAVDWMLDARNPTQKAVADSFLTWLTKDGGTMARRLGVQYVIWNKTTWRAYAPERGFTPYSGASPHTDHIHISLTWDGAMGRTSWWSGRAVTTRDVGTCRVFAGQPAPLYTGVRREPCPSWVPAPPQSPLPIVAIGSRDRANVARGQKALGITADGVFGRGTQKAVVAWQRAHGLPTSGAFDKPTWNRLVPAAASTTAPRSATPTRPVATLQLPTTVTRPLAAYKKTVLRAGSRGAAVRALQTSIGARRTGVMDAPTVRAVKNLQSRWRLQRTGVVDLRTWNRAELTRYPWLGYVKTPLSRGATGPAVAALQKALGVGADGEFGPVTSNAVQGIQRRYGLPTTGVVDAATWRAVTHAAR